MRAIRGALVLIIGVDSCPFVVRKRKILNFSRYLGLNLGKYTARRPPKH